MFASLASKIVHIVKETVAKLGENHLLILASSTAFFATFSIPPIIIILTNVLSLYFKTEHLSVEFNNQISNLFGAKAAEQLQAIANNLSDIGGKSWITIAGSLFLIFVATNLFKVIRASIDQIWNIRPKKSKKVVMTLRNRAIALGIILLTGIIFLLSIFADSVVSLLGEHLQSYLPDGYVFLIQALSKVITLFFITLWFIALFRYQTDALVHWKAIRIGGLITAILFMIGKFALEKLLVNSNIGDIFETSASIVLVLLFIFYSSMILYFGAALTFVLSKEFHKTIKPRKNAEKFETKVIDGNEPTQTDAT